MCCNLVLPVHKHRLVVLFFAFWRRLQALTVFPPVRDKSRGLYCVVLKTSCHEVLLLCLVVALGAVLVRSLHLANIGEYLVHVCFGPCLASCFDQPRFRLRTALTRMYHVKQAVYRDLIVRSILNSLNSPGRVLLEDLSNSHNICFTTVSVPRNLCLQASSRYFWNKFQILLYFQEGFGYEDACETNYCFTRQQHQTMEHEACHLMQKDCQNIQLP